MATGELGAGRSAARTGPPSGPVGLGYLRLTPGSAALVADGMAVMEEVAGRCGYALGEVFVEDHPLRQLGWASLLDAVRTQHPVAVLIPDVEGLRLTGRELTVLRARLRQVTTAPLVPARPAAAWVLADLAPPTMDAPQGRPRQYTVSAGAVAARRARAARTGRWLSWGS